MSFTEDWIYRVSLSVSLTDQERAAYEAKLVEEGYDTLDMASTLTDSDLRILGISKRAHRQAILNELAKLPPTVMAPAAGSIASSAMPAALAASVPMPIASAPPPIMTPLPRPTLPVTQPPALPAAHEPGLLSSMTSARAPSLPPRALPLLPQIPTLARPPRPPPPLLPNVGASVPHPPRMPPGQIPMRAPFLAAGVPSVSAPAHSSSAPAPSISHPPRQPPPRLPSPHPPIMAQTPPIYSAAQLVTSTAHTVSAPTSLMGIARPNSTSIPSQAFTTAAIMACDVLSDTSLDGLRTLTNMISNRSSPEDLSEAEQTQLLKAIFAALQTHCLLCDVVVARSAMNLYERVAKLLFKHSGKEHVGIILRTMSIHLVDLALVQSGLGVLHEIILLGNHDFILDLIVEEKIFNLFFALLFIAVDQPPGTTWWLSSCFAVCNCMQLMCSQSAVVNTFVDTFPSVPGVQLLMQCLSKAMMDTENSSEIATSALSILVVLAEHGSLQMLEHMSESNNRAIMVCLKDSQKDAKILALVSQLIHRLAQQPAFQNFLGCGELLCSTITNALGNFEMSDAQSIVIDLIAALYDMRSSAVEWSQMAVAALTDTLKRYCEQSAQVVIWAVTLLNTLLDMHVEPPSIKDVLLFVLLAATNYQNNDAALETCMRFLSEFCSRPALLLRSETNLISPLECYEDSILTAALAALVRSEDCMLAASRVLVTLAPHLSPSRINDVLGKVLHAFKIIPETLHSSKPWDIVECYLQSGTQLGTEVIDDVCAVMMARLNSDPYYEADYVLVILCAVFDLPNVTLSPTTGAMLNQGICELLNANDYKTPESAKAMANVFTVVKRLFSAANFDNQTFSALGPVLFECIDKEQVYHVSQGVDGVYSIPEANGGGTSSFCPRNQWLDWLLDLLTSPNAPRAISLFDLARFVSLKDKIVFSFEICEPAPSRMLVAIRALTFLLLNSPEIDPTAHFDLVIDVVYEFLLKNLAEINLAPDNFVINAFLAFDCMSQAVRDSNSLLPDIRSELLVRIELFGFCAKAQDPSAAPSSLRNPPILDLVFVVSFSNLLQGDQPNEIDLATLRRLNNSASVEDTFETLIEEKRTWEALMQILNKQECGPDVAHLALQCITTFARVFAVRQTSSLSNTSNEIILAQDGLRTIISAVNRFFKEQMVVRSGLEVLTVLSQNAFGAQRVLDSGGVALVDRVLERKGQYMGFPEMIALAMDCLQAIVMSTKDLAWSQSDYETGSRMFDYMAERLAKGVMDKYTPAKIALRKAYNRVFCADEAAGGQERKRYHLQLDDDKKASSDFDKRSGRLDPYHKRGRDERRPPARRRSAKRSPTVARQRRRR